MEKTEDNFSKWIRLRQTGDETTITIKEIVDEFIEQVLIGEINPETNTRDIEIEFNLIRLVPCLKEYLPGISRVSVY